MIASLYLLVVGFVFWLIFFVLFSRFVFQLIRAPFVNQIAQWVYTTTNPILRPLERIVPRWNQASLAALALLFLASMIRTLLMFGLDAFSLAGVLYSLGAAIGFGLSYWMWAIILYVVLSWLFSVVAARRGNDFVELVFAIGMPPCRLVRRFIPTQIGPFDFSPIIAMFILFLLNMLQAQAFHAIAPFEPAAPGIL